jgi:hypothetical protein
MATKRVALTYEMLMAASRDAGNASMRKAGRSKWSRRDWNAACAVADRLRPYLALTSAVSP